MPTDRRCAKDVSNNFTPPLIVCKHRSAIGYAMLIRMKLGGGQQSPRKCCSRTHSRVLENFGTDFRDFIAGCAFWRKAAKYSTLRCINSTPSFTRAERFCSSVLELRRYERSGRHLSAESRILSKAMRRSGGIPTRTSPGIRSRIRYDR